MKTIKVSLPKRYDKEEVILIREPAKKHQKKVKVRFET